MNRSMEVVTLCLRAFQVLAWPPEAISDPTFSLLPGTALTQSMKSEPARKLYSHKGLRPPLSCLSFPVTSSVQPGLRTSQPSHSNEMRIGMAPITFTFPTGVNPHNPIGSHHLHQVRMYSSQTAWPILATRNGSCNKNTQFGNLWSSRSSKKTLLFLLTRKPCHTACTARLTAKCAKVIHNEM